jgi:hypothetical protein
MTLKSVPIDTWWWMLRSTGGPWSRPMHRRTMQNGSGTRATKAGPDGGIPCALHMSPSRRGWGDHAGKDPDPTRTCRLGRLHSQDRSSGASGRSSQALGLVPARDPLHARSRSKVAQAERGEWAESVVSRMLRRRSIKWLWPDVKPEQEHSVVSAVTWRNAHVVRIGSLAGRRSNGGG